MRAVLLQCCAKVAAAPFFSIVLPFHQSAHMPGCCCWSCCVSCQEHFLERWSKLVVPKLQEEAKLSKTEEDVLRARKVSSRSVRAAAAAPAVAVCGLGRRGTGAVLLCDHSS
jgi:hypothetical protein